MIKSPLKYPGGKFLLAKWIISYFPPHKVYVEPFCGACHVLCAKEPSHLEILNDKNGELVNFLMTLRANPIRLARACASLPHSRRLFYQFRDQMFISNFDKALRWFYLNHYSFAGLSKSWGYSRGGGEVRNLSHSYHSALSRFQTIAERLKYVQIDDKDFRDIIKTYDSKDTLFYCDPPFVGKEDYYPVKFTEKDHRDLAKMLHRIKGKLVLNYYPHPLIKELYSDFYCIKKRITKTMPKIKRPKVTELLLMNFKPVYCQMSRQRILDLSKSKS